MRAFILLNFFALAASTAHADPVVLAIDGKDLYVDLGAKDGVGEGSQLQLLHEVVAKDPRTGATLRDHFALGVLTVAKTGDAICVAHADAELAKRVLAGDQVRLLSPKRAFVDPWEEQVAASKQAEPLAAAPGSPVVDHAAIARQAWQDTLGKSPENRIARWTELLQQDPQSPYRRSIEGEIASLRSQIAAREAALEQARSSTIDDRSPRITQLAAMLAMPFEDRGLALVVAPIERAVPGRPIELAFLVRAPAAIQHAWIYVRPKGEPGFRRIELVRDGDAYLRGQIAGSLVREGGLDWYAEAAGADPGSAEPVVGNQLAPRTIQIDRVVTEVPIEEGRSHVDVLVDYVDFDGKLSKGFDQYYQAEIDFGYRFIDPIYAVRLGFGTLSGVGGPKDVIDLHPDTCLDADGAYRCKRVTFSYVYTEFEHRIRRNVAVMLRPQAGLLTTDTMPGTDGSRCQSREIAGCEFTTGFGARLRLRFGEEQGTNLVLGAGFTRGVGTLFEASYHWLPARVVPVQLAVQVTDQPVPRDFGVRLIGDVGWRQLSWFYPSVRVSYQARDINHAGVSGGVAMNFDW